MQSKPLPEYTIQWPHPRIVQLKPTAQANRSFLKMVIGPMYSGKTTVLGREILTWAKSGKSCIIIKHSLDGRYSNENVVTHDGMSWKAMPCSSIMATMDLLLKHDVIGIDEGSFFEDILPGVMTLLNNKKCVFVSLLDADYAGAVFPPKQPLEKSWVHLITHAATVVKLTGVCAFCGSRDAGMSIKVGTPTSDIDVGGDDKYACVCTDCWLSETEMSGILIPSGPTPALESK